MLNLIPAQLHHHNLLSFHFFTFFSGKKESNKESCLFRRNELVASAELPPLQTGPCNIASLRDGFNAYSALLEFQAIVKLISFKKQCGGSPRKTPLPKRSLRLR